MKKTLTEKELPDYEIARQEMTALYESLGNRHEIEGGELITNDETGWTHNAWRFKLKNSNGAAIVLPYKTGTGCKGVPSPAEVLANHCRDVMDVEGRTFEDWAAEMGYDTDSRKAEANFRQCGVNRGKLIDWLACGKAGSIGIDRLKQFAELSARL